MVPFDLIVYAFTCVVLILLICLCQRIGCGGKTKLTALKPPRAKREPKPFAGFIRKPQCDLCDRPSAPHPPSPGAPPPHMTFTRGRRRHVDTTAHFCPDTTCSYHGWLGLGNIRANGHPGGRRCRQLVCLSCRSYFLETVGTPFHGKQT
jgi:hypothetical protein